MRSRRSRYIAESTTVPPGAVVAAAMAIALTACSSKGTAVKVGGQTKAAPVPSAVISMISPSRLVPDIRNERGVVAYESGARRALVNRMRIVIYDDGTVERAAELLPLGNVHAVPLPSRLGGGFVFHASTGGGTQVWRASSWLGRLKPLVQFGSMATDLVPGFDRIYVRLSGNNKLLAIDAETGESRSVDPLPPAAAYGALAFADGFRGVVDVDMRGVLATFDAGATWRPLGLSEKPTAITVVDGDPTIYAAKGRYVLDARGNLTFRGHAAVETDEGVDTKLPTPRGPFGKRPLRAAVEDGYPDSNETAVVARSGALARISLRTGAIVEMSTSAFPERDATCHGVRLGASFGFVCGEHDGATNVYAFDPPLSMHKVLSFRGPRFVSASGNGALVIRGPCGEGPEDDDGMRVYCVRSALGNTREVRVKGDLGVERVVALGDGRVAILVPPRNGGTGQITVVDGSKVATSALSLPTKPRSVVRELRRGMWLEGFEEREAGVIGGWVEAGGPVIGVRVAIDGKVKAGEPRNNENGVIMSGRFALSQGEGGRAAESTDGGVSWKVFDMPEHDISPGDADTRACGPLGCVLGGWVRVGWGKPATAGDLTPAPTPPSMYVPSTVSPTVNLRCSPMGKAVTEPLPDKPVKPAPAPVVAMPRYPSGPFGRFPLPPTVAPRSPWQSFRNSPPPTLGADEVGIDNGVPYDLVSMRAYAWGKKGADWARLGHFIIRFDDRFDPLGGMRSTGIAPPPWADEVATMDAMGIGSYPIVTWGSYLDASGRHALVTLCKGGACSHFAASEGQPALHLRDVVGRTAVAPRPYPHGAVRVGESWFFVTPGPSSDTVAVYRADLGVIRRLALYHRPVAAPGSRYSSHTNAEAPRIVRRAIGNGIGLLFTALAAPGERSGGMFVLPIDPDTGELGEPILLGKRDLAGQLPPRCAEGQDGWLLDTGLDMNPNVQLTSGRAVLDTIEFRLRMDPGAVCVEAMAARIDGAFVPDKDAKSSTDKPTGTVTLSATERMTGRRWAFTCGKR
ncbi:MAG: PQQ-binding-like beta-propeller repeat protein [Polyangiaceae bacterium]|nr:PQQ-binding-like beta-propeller repeat protein [Polyangiaceae bacterium]